MTIQLLGHPTPFFRLLDVDHSAVDDYSEAIPQLRAGELTGVIVRGVYDAEFLAGIVSRLEQHDPPFLKTWFPEKFRSWFYGQNLNLMETDADSYFRESARFDAQVRELLPQPNGFVERVLKAVSGLDQSQPCRAAPGPEPGQTYMMTTFRGHAEGGYIPPHCDNEQAYRPAYEHLHTLVSDHMYSVVLLLSKPESGGALEVFDYRVEPRNAQLMNDDGVTDKPDITQLSSVAFELNAGDLIVVDSGRFLHRVTPVIGSTIRWTACSFMARARDRRAAYCWG
jgi:Carrier-protein-independent halogenase WelO5